MKNSTLLDRKIESFNSSDEYYTPSEAVEKYIKSSLLSTRYTIWEPTDLSGKLEITKTFKKYNYNVFHSGLPVHDLGEGEFEIDFLKELPLIPDDYFIVTNPPYSKKLAFLKRCVELLEKDFIKGFALLLPISNLCGVNTGNIWKGLVEKDYTFSLYPFKRRVNFITSNNKKSANWFDVAWFEIENNLTVKHNGVPRKYIHWID